MIVIIDYGMGNPASIQNMFRKVGRDSVVSNDLNIIKTASAIVLPGIGSFNNGMNKLDKTGIGEILKLKVLDEKVPFLGVCLGMHLLFNKSEEGNVLGLGWISGKVKRFDFQDVANTENLKVPHMGWNVVNPVDDNSIFKTNNNELRYYFAHSFYVQCEDPSDALATSHFGYEFTCAVRKGNIFGVQFHPEKSHRFGMELFKNFLELVPC